MSYPPQGGGYQSGGDGYPDGNQPPPQQYDLYDQQTSGPGYQGGYQQQDPYGWGQAPQSPAGAYPPQSPAGGYPQQGYQPQPQAYPQQGQYQQPGFTPQPPPKKSKKSSSKIDWGRRRCRCSEGGWMPTVTVASGFSLPGAVARNAVEKIAS